MFNPLSTKLAPWYISKSVKAVFAPTQMALGIIGVFWTTLAESL